MPAATGFLYVLKRETGAPVFPVEERPVPTSDMLTGLQKYAGKAVRQRGSSPKLQVMNTALMTAQSGLSPDEARADREFRGRLVESAVGRASRQRSRARRLRAVLLAQAQPRGGLRGACRPHRHRHGSEERPRARHVSRPWRLCGGVQAEADTAGWRGVSSTHRSRVGMVPEPAVLLSVEEVDRDARDHPDYQALPRLGGQARHQPE